MKKLFITGTDTDVGKTIVSAGLCMAWPAHYWKPIQAGYSSIINTSNSSEPALTKKILPGTDNELISRFIPEQNIYPSSYTLKNPLSPNQAAKIERVHIQKEKINYPECSSNLIIEGAGGALVPFNEREDMTDLMKKMDCPVIVVARSTLGTLNHTFLTLAVLRAKNIPVLGVIMVGPPHPNNKKDIEEKGNTSVLLELPIIENLSADTLKLYCKRFIFPF
jgi:dethiobiotin synthase